MAWYPFNLKFIIDNPSMTVREVFYCSTDTCDYQLPSLIDEITEANNGGIDYSLTFTIDGITYKPGDVVTLTRGSTTIYVSVTEKDPSGSGGSEGNTEPYPGGPQGDFTYDKPSSGETVYTLKKGKYLFPAGLTYLPSTDIGRAPVPEDGLYGDEYENLHFTTMPTMEGRPLHMYNDPWTTEMVDYFGISVLVNDVLNTVNQSEVHFYGNDIDYMTSIVTPFTDESGVYTDGFTMILSSDQEVSYELYTFITNNTTYKTFPKISGKWRFKDSLVSSLAQYYSTYSYDINFTSNGKSYTNMTFKYQTFSDNEILSDLYESEVLLFNDDPAYIYSGYLKSGDTGVSDYWINSEYKIVDFGTTPQEVSDELYIWLLANAGMGEAPTISLDGTILTITPVEGAVSYHIYANNVKVASTTSLIVDLNSIAMGSAGTYSITVKAVYEAGESVYSNNVIYEIAYTIPQQTLSNAASGLTLATENTIADKNIGIHLSYLDIIKLNNPTNIKSGETLFGIPGTYTAETEIQAQAGVVIHDGYSTTIYPFYGSSSNLYGSWSLSASALNFNDGRVHKFISYPDKTFSGLSDSLSGNSGLNIGESDQLTGGGITGEIFEYWAIYE